jgi:hypothetical protein
LDPQNCELTFINTFNMTTMAAQQIDNNLAQDEAREEEEAGFVEVDALTRTYRSSCEL